MNSIILYHLFYLTVSGINMIYIIPSVCAVCIFYTTVGGLKAVIWTDTIQFLIMNGSILLIIIIGIINEGGVSKIWGIAEDSGRINFFEYYTLYNYASRKLLINIINL